MAFIYNQEIRYNNGNVCLAQIAHYLYKDYGWVVEYADEDGVYGMGDKFTGTERFTWEDDPSIAVTHDQLVARRAEVGPILEWGRLRFLRNKKLTESDWTQAPDVPTETRAAWTTYRQALRDLPSTTTDPRNPTWPTPPS